MVLNGLFGVAKSSSLPSGEPVLRVIMNLIPINGVLCQLKGLVSELPGICQYMSMYLGPGEEMKICQSDMTSAFYLFALPDEWAPFLTFDLSFTGDLLGKGAGSGEYYLSCRVLPMGWSSAVGVMQEFELRHHWWQVFMWLNVGSSPRSLQGTFLFGKTGEMAQKKSLFLQLQNDLCCNSSSKKPWVGCFLGSGPGAIRFLPPWFVLVTVVAHLAQLTKRRNVVNQAGQLSVKNRTYNGAAEQIHSEIVHQHSQSPLPAHARLLSTPKRGYVASAKENNDGQVTVGVHFSPEEFLTEAIRLCHPTEQNCLFPREVRTNVSHLSNRSVHQVALDRTEEVKRWVSMAKGLSTKERDLKTSISPRISWGHRSGWRHNTWVWFDRSFA